jgi:peptidoglycan/xylan/chitin deacetylase (PgdA/CDA1 family)
MSENSYYHSLNPFRSLFETGVPVLTYHKLGPRPGGVRIKGLYMDPELFDRQVEELSGAGFQTVSLSAPFPAAANPARSVVLTFDDGFRNVHRHALGPLARTGMRAVEFIVADLIGKTNEWDQSAGEVEERLMEEAEIRDWLAAGHDIGSHSLTHPHLTRIPPAQAREEIGASKRKLEDRFGRAIEHFCYPYGDWDESVREMVREAGYRTACTTEGGVNTSTTPPLALKRITARYRSRKLAEWLPRWSWKVA